MSKRRKNRRNNKEQADIQLQDLNDEVSEAVPQDSDEWDGENLEAALTAALDQAIAQSEEQEAAKNAEEVLLAEDGNPGAQEAQDAQESLEAPESDANPEEQEAQDVQESLEAPETGANPEEQEARDVQESLEAPESGANPEEQEVQDGQDVTDAEAGEGVETKADAAEETKKRVIPTPEETSARNQRRAREAKEIQKREERRRKRVRTQIICWIAFLLIVAAVTVGIIFGVQAIQTGKIDISKWLPSVGQERPSEQIEIPPYEPVPEEPSQTPNDVIADLIGEEGEMEEPVPLPEPEPEPTPEEQLDAIIDAKIAEMPIEDRVAGLFLVTPESITGANAATKAGPGTQEALTKYALGGLVYDSKNFQSQEQFGEMLSTTLTYTKYATFLAIAEEGGKFSPLANAGVGSKTDSLQKLAEATAAAAETGDTSYAAAYEAGKTIASNLLSVGITLDLGPVADLAALEGNILGERSFGSDPYVVAENVKAMLQGMKDHNMTACIKFFPGLGSVKDDPAKKRVISERSAQEYLEQDFVVYHSLVDSGLVSMVMMSNLIIPALDESGTPASLSETIVTGQLRNTIGYDGVILSGNLSDAAIKDYYGAAEAAVLALRAGCDMIYAPENFEAAYQGVLDAVSGGVIAPERINDALKRVYRIKYADSVFGMN